MREHELFKQAVMQYLVDDAHTQRASKQHKKHPVVRRILVAAACLLVALGVTVFSIPSARAAVEEWISGWFSTSDYFGQEKEERAKEPTIEAIITTADGNTAKVTEVGEGYEAYADDFSMTLDEIAYDGESIFFSGTMSGATARPFVQAFTGGDTFHRSKIDASLNDDLISNYDYYACESLVEFKIGDEAYIGNIVATMTDDMHPILQAGATETEPVYMNGKLMTTNSVTDPLWDAYLSEHEVRFSIELIKIFTHMQPLTGIVQGDLSLKLYYANEQGTEAESVLSADFGKITIDANAYQQQTQTMQAKDDLRVDLGGVHPVTITEWQPEAERTSVDCEIYTYTHELDFTGASYSLKEISFTPTDTLITLHITFPQTWSKKELAGVNLYFHFLFDEKKLDFDSFIPFRAHGPYQTFDQTGLTREFDCTFRESTIPPSQWKTIKTLTIIPVTAYWWDMKVSYDNEPQTEISLRDGAVYTGIVNHTRYEYDTLYDEMPQYAITVNLDDFR